MEQRCEVCESFRPHDLNAAQELLEVPFGERAVTLCRGHAGIAQNSQIESLEGLRELYAESEGRRSYIARRARTLRALADGTRNVGRRVTDVPG